jgi:CBS domain-containing protein
MSKTARDVMTPGAAWPGEDPTDGEVARMLGPDRHVESAATPAPHPIGADDWVDAALATMTELRVRRLPVVDHGQLVGTVSQGDLASSIERPETWSWLCS